MDINNYLIPEKVLLNKNKEELQSELTLINENNKEKQIKLIA